MKPMPVLTSRGSQVQANTVLELRSSFCSVGSVQGNGSAIFCEMLVGNSNGVCVQAGTDAVCSPVPE